MKKFVSLLLALMMALGMTALAEESKDQLARIQEKGEIVIATEGTWAPWTYTDENGTLVGFDVEIATAIAEKLGVKATFVTVEWDGILAGIDSGRYDIAANGIDVTEQRSEKYNFSTPYAFNRTALVVRGDNEDIKSFEDLKGKKDHELHRQHLHDSGGRVRRRGGWRGYALDQTIMPGADRPQRTRR